MRPTTVEVFKYVALSFIALGIGMYLLLALIGDLQDYGFALNPLLTGILMLILWEVARESNHKKEH